MRRCDSWTRGRRVLALTAAGVVMLACGDPSAEEQRQRLADDLVEETNGALDEDAALCVADGLHDEFGDESFEAVLDAARDEDGSADVRTQVIDIFSGCDALGPIIDDGS